MLAAKTRGPARSGEGSPGAEKKGWPFVMSNWTRGGGFPGKQTHVQHSHVCQAQSLRMQRGMLPSAYACARDEERQRLGRTPSASQWMDSGVPAERLNEAVGANLHATAPKKGHQSHLTPTTHCPRRGGPKLNRLWWRAIRILPKKKKSPKGGGEGSRRKRQRLHLVRHPPSHDSISLPAAARSACILTARGRGGWVVGEGCHIPIPSITPRLRLSDGPCLAGP